MKSIKIVLLSFSLAAILMVTSSAMSQNKNETTILNTNKNNISQVDDKSNMEIDQSEEKNIPTQDTYNDLINIYHKYLSSQPEKNSRENIKNLLTKFEKLCPVDDKNDITKDIKEMSILDFNELQSILLDYYNFSVLFTIKYSPFATLMKTYVEKIFSESNKYTLFYQIYNRLIKNISKYVKTLNNFCYNLLFKDTFNAAIQDLYFNNINTETNKYNRTLNILNNKTSGQLPGLSSDLQEIFHNTQTEMISNSQLWGNTFSKYKFKHNTFIDEDTAYNKFEVTPKISQDYEIPINLKDQIPHQYKINSHILAAVYKMELLKSQYYMKKFKNNNLKNKKTGTFFSSYKKTKKYANDIFKTYNSLRSFIVLDKGLSSIGSDDQDKTTASEIFKKDAKSFNEDLKKYTSDDTNNVYDLISFLICELKKNNGNGSDKKDLLKFISKSDFNNKYHIDSIPKLYNHISNNNESYNQLFGIYNVQDLKEFYLQIDENTASKNTNSNPNKENEYQSLNEFLGPKAIDYLKNEKTENKGSYTNRNLNLSIAKGLLDYYNRNWRLDKNRRQNILKRFEDFDEIYKNFDNKYKIQKNANISNENFNSLQSTLLDYYKFLLFFSKYNNLIKTITTKTCKMKNYDQLKVLPQLKLFVDNYKSFTDSIKEQVTKLKKFVNEMLTENFKDPENTDNITPENNLTQLLTMSEEILKLEPNFKEIFKIMGIDQITDEKVLDEKTSLEDIDVIPKIDGNKAYLKLHSINAAPPHYRINLDILAAILKMEIVKLLPYFKKMQDTKVLNDQEKNIDINFTQSKKKMGNYINTIYQFYDKLKSYMVWSMYSGLFYVHNQNIYPNNPHMINSTKRIDKILGKEEDFVKKIQAYIKDDNQFYTSLYLLPDESKNSSKDPSKKPSTKKGKKEKKGSSKNSTKLLPINLFKLYYERRQNCINKEKSQITLLAKHTLKKQEIYDNFMNNNDPNISDMKLLDQFFSKLDPGYFTVLSKVNANKNNPSIFQKDAIEYAYNANENELSIFNNLPIFNSYIFDTNNYDNFLLKKNEQLNNENKLKKSLFIVKNSPLTTKNKDDKKLILKQPKKAKLKINNSTSQKNDIEYAYDADENELYDNFLLKKNEQLNNQNKLKKSLFIVKNSPSTTKNKDDKKLILKQPKKTKLKINNSTPQKDDIEYAYEADENELSIFNNLPIFNSYILNPNHYDNFLSKKDEQLNNENNNFISLSEDLNNTYSQQLFGQNHIQNIDDNLMPLRKEEEKYTKQNEDPINNNALINIENNKHLWDLDFGSDLYHGQKIMSEPTNNQNDIDNAYYININSQNNNNNFTKEENDFIMNLYPPLHNENESLIFGNQNDSIDYFNVYDNNENYKLLGDRNELSLYLDELTKINNQTNNSLIGKNAQQTVQNQFDQNNNNNFILEENEEEANSFLNRKISRKKK